MMENLTRFPPLNINHQPADSRANLFALFLKFRILNFFSIISGFPEGLYKSFKLKSLKVQTYLVVTLVEKNFTIWPVCSGLHVLYTARWGCRIILNTVGNFPLVIFHRAQWRPFVFPTQQPTQNLLTRDSILREFSTQLTSAASILVGFQEIRLHNANATIIYPPGRLFQAFDISAISISVSKYWLGLFIQTASQGLWRINYESWIIHANNYSRFHTDCSFTRTVRDYESRIK